jgi:hypothetical protein
MVTDRARWPLGSDVANLTVENTVMVKQRASLRLSDSLNAPASTSGHPEVGRREQHQEQRDGGGRRLDRAQG